jgi:hypothetical protein
LELKQIIWARNGFFFMSCSLFLKFNHCYRPYNQF